jgi:lipopolysaccharide/colanic/teichoic acid biosynthesis glycosyltransferase
MLDVPSATASAVRPASEAQAAGGQWMKRTADIVASGLLLLIASPLLLAVALLVKSSSPGPILFRQPRLGRNGQPFRVLKFRTMCADAEAMLERDPELRTLYLAGGHKVPDSRDPRVTPIGRRLRASGIDELPQLLNVLRGEMSLVGPRPIVAAELGRYPSYLDVMRSTRPGLTGPWQVRRRSSADYEARARLDREYSLNHSLAVDAVIVLRTIARLGR